MWNVLRLSASTSIIDIPVAIMSDYELLPSSEPAIGYINEGAHEEITTHRSSTPVLHHRQKWLVIWLASFISVVIVLSGVRLATKMLHKSHRFHEQFPTSCALPIIRTEWRNLKKDEKHKYILAVQCLQTVPSIRPVPESRYDDFAYFHARVSLPYQQTAGFLPWHRYFLHIYESTLRERCQYTGHLPYWDWMLDSDDFRDSPVWHHDTGFGGDGDLNAPESVRQGHCVTDGPFANLTALYWHMNAEPTPHCLSRGFQSGSALRGNVTRRIEHDALQRLLEIGDYDTFNVMIENGPHLAIPLGVRGDFDGLTSPYGRSIPRGTI